MVIPSKYGNIVFLFLSKETYLEFMKEKYKAMKPNTINRTLNTLLKGYPKRE